VRKMENKIENTMEYYLGNPDDLKEKIAKMCIDMSGTMQNKKVLVRVSRKNGISLKYHKSGGNNVTHQIFQYEFPIFYYRDLSYALFIRRIRKGVFYLVDANDNFVKQINVSDEKVITEVLLDDLLVKDYGNFNDRWNEFLGEFQKWLEE